jgi:3-oxoacyl-[acyl-carrier protein] reductase
MERKRVLVTGSSRGIGRAIALKLAEEGWSVAVHYTAGVDEANATVKSLGDSAAGLYQTDLADPSCTASLFEMALADGSIQALVNNAGVYLPQDFSTCDDASFEATWSRTFAINLESPARLMRVAARHFAENGGGKVLNVASRVGFRGEPGAAIYAASKAALINLTRSLAVEMASKNVGFFGIAPGWVETAMVRDGMADRLESILATIPLKRMASPEDCAAVSAFLLSDAASYLSGVTIDINGASYLH